MIQGMLTLVFMPVLNLQPIVGILILSGLVALTTTIINKFALASEEAKETMKKIKETRIKMLEAQKSKDPDKINESLMKLLKINSEYQMKYLKFMIKPIIFSMVLAAILLPWMNNVYSGKTIAILPKIIPVVGGAGLTWIWWYAICTLVLGIIFKRLIGD